MKAELIPGDKIDRNEWDTFVKESPEGMPYSFCYYLDIVSPGWSGIILRNDGKICGLMPLPLKKKRGFTYSFQPPYAQHLGILFSPKEKNNNYQEYSFKRKAVAEIISQIPSSVRLFSAQFSPSFDYAIPFHSEGYSLFTRYTYHLPLKESQESLLAGMSAGTRNEIKKNALLEEDISEEKNPDTLISLAEKNIKAGKNVIAGGRSELLKKLSTEILHRGQGVLLTLRDKKGEPLASGLFLDGNGKRIYLAGVQDPGNKTPGIMTTVIWKAISLEAGKDIVFDFEGSMIDGIESFFRGFGGKPVPYLHIHRNRLPLFLKWIKN